TKMTVCVEQFEQGDVDHSLVYDRKDVRIQMHHLLPERASLPCLSSRLGSNDASYCNGYSWTAGACVFAHRRTCHRTGDGWIGHLRCDRTGWTRTTSSRRSVYPSRYRRSPMRSALVGMEASK